MKVKTQSVRLNSQGIDLVSETMQGWLETAGFPRREILRIRLTLEELLAAISAHSGEDTPAELRFGKHFGKWEICLHYGGARFDPVEASESDADKWMSTLLLRTGFQPSWHWRGGKNELLFRISAQGRRSEFLMLGCIAAAVAIGLLGQLLPEAFKTVVTDYALSFLSDFFLHLLNTFIGLMIFLSIVTGICGIGSSCAEASDENRKRIAAPPRAKPIAFGKAVRDAEAERFVPKKKKPPYGGFSLVENAGLEPVTSCV